MTTTHKLDRDRNPIADEKFDKPASCFAMELVNPSGATIYDIHRDGYIGYLCALKKMNMKQIGKITHQNVFCSPDHRFCSSSTKTITRRATNVGVQPRNVR